VVVVVVVVKGIYTYKIWRAGGTFVRRDFLRRWMECPLKL